MGPLFYTFSLQLCLPVSSGFLPPDGPDTGYLCLLHQLQPKPRCLGDARFQRGSVSVQTGTQRGPHADLPGALKGCEPQSGLSGNTTEWPTMTVNCGGHSGAAQLSPGLSQRQWTFLAPSNGSQTGQRREIAKKSSGSFTHR